ncbi:MAG: LysR family transcriptional regulator [Armatimonadetes bacterium]|nr:LysR family transcriptional regulator [Akkermansiaceae bacterium]
MSRTKLKLKGLSLDRLETLSGIVAQGSIARAAGGDVNRQSQFSRQVAELEDWFGVCLLDRSSVPNKPTPAGLRIAREMDDFLRNMESVRDEAGKGRQRVVFGAGERMIRSYLIPWASKVSKDKLRFVFRNLTSRTTRTELLAKRVDFGIMRAGQCPTGFASVALKPMRMAFMLPPQTSKEKRKWGWKDLENIPLVLLDGHGLFRDFLGQMTREAGMELDVALECSTWTQVIDAMRDCRMGGFLPKDLEKQFPPDFMPVQLPGLSEYTDDYVIAWSAAEAGKRPEIARLAKRLGGN